MSVKDLVWEGDIDSTIALLPAKYTNLSCDLWYLETLEFGKTVVPSLPRVLPTQLVRRLHHVLVSRATVAPQPWRSVKLSRLRWTIGEYRCCVSPLDGCASLWLRVADIHSQFAGSDHEARQHPPGRSRKANSRHSRHSRNPRNPRNVVAVP